MRRRTRTVVLAVLAVAVVLIALGAVPGLLRSGDPYFVTATATVEASLAENRTALNVTRLPESRYPYTTAALAAATADRAGRSEPYWKGPLGVKEAFTHSPFDELAALRQRNATAATDDGVFVRDNGTLYTLAVTRETDE